MVKNKIYIPKEKIGWSELASGLKVVTIEMPNFYTVSAGLFTYAGSRFEKKEDMGISHFIEHLLFKGSKKYSAKEISELIEGRGGILNAYTAEESTCFYFKTLPSSFFESLDVLVDLYTQPLFDSIELDKERDVIIEEIHSYEDQPSAYVEDLFGSVIWKGHPLGNFVLGLEENIARFTVNDVESYFRRHFTTSNTVLAVAGCIEHEDVVKWVKQEEARFLSGPRNSFEPFLLRQNASRSTLLYKDIEQCNVQMGVPCSGRHSQEQWAMRLLNTIAGENMSSRLFQEIRENQGLAYNISSSIDFYEDTGAFSLQVGVDAEKVEVCLQQSLQVLQELAVTQVSENELNRAKTFSIGQALQDMESTLSYMLWVGDKLLNNEEDFATAQFCENIEAVTANDVKMAAEKIFCSNHLNLALVGPCEDTGALIESLSFNPLNK